MRAQEDAGGICFYCIVSIIAASFSGSIDIHNFAFASRNFALTVLAASPTLLVLCLSGDCGTISRANLPMPATETSWLGLASRHQPLLADILRFKRHSIW